MQMPYPLHQMSRRPLLDHHIPLRFPSRCYAQTVLSTYIPVTCIKHIVSLCSERQTSFPTTDFPRILQASETELIIKEHLDFKIAYM